MKANKPVIDGITFGSDKEALIYHEFKVNPDIQILHFHPKFVLQEKFLRYEKTIRAINYTADFIVAMNEREWVVEVKSIWTIKKTDYPLRRKLFLYTHPRVRFWEIIFDGKKRTDVVW